MADIIHSDSIADMLENFGRGVFFAPLRTPKNNTPQMKVDVTEADKTYTLRAELPGVKKEDINISIEGNKVSLRAEVKQQKSEKQGESLLQQECYYGNFYRSFALAQDIDEGQAQAKYTDGILELTLPKKAGSGPRRLTVS